MSVWGQVRLCYRPNWAAFEEPQASCSNDCLCSVPFAAFLQYGHFLKYMVDMLDLIMFVTYMRMVCAECRAKEKQDRQNAMQAAHKERRIKTVLSLKSDMEAIEVWLLKWLHVGLIYRQTEVLYRPLYRVGQNGTIFVHLIISPNINRFSKFLLSEPGDNF